jgi:hypothetical protein
VLEATWILSQCILRGAICILQKFLGNMDTSSKQFLFRRKESILSAKENENGLIIYTSMIERGEM